MSIQKITALAGIGIITFLSLFSLAFAQAQNNGEGGSGLRLEDTKTEENVDPGASKEISFNLKNITKSQLIAKAFINDFESDNVSGTPQIIVDNSERTPNSVFNFVKGLKDIELKPGETKVVKLKLELPSDIPPGAYFGAIRYAAIPTGQGDAPAPDPNSRQVSLTASVAHLVFVEVSGDIVKQISIENLKLQKKDQSSSIFFQAPDKSALGIKNLGNGFARPFGAVTINHFTNKEVYKYDVNTTNPKGIVLPKSSRTFTDNVNNIKLPGRYTATAAIAYGDGGEVITYKTSFWYLPGWFLLILLLVIALVGGGIYFLYERKFAPKKSSRRRSSR